MPKKLKLFAAGLFLTLVGIACFVLVTASAKAEDANYEQSGDGWSISADGVMTIESNQGWANCLKVGFEGNPWKLIIGKDVASFRMYDLPEDLPSEDFFDSEDIITYSASGNPIYDYTEIESLFPSKIAVEEGNSAFRVIDGLLINTVTNELVLSEMGVTDVVVPEGVRIITKGAFLKRNLTAIQLPNSLYEIGDYAFAKCDDLKNITLPDSVEKIGTRSFSMCSALGSVVLSKNLRVIANNAFNECGIQNIEIPPNVYEIGQGAFRDCEQLKQVILPDSLRTIKMIAFSDCEQLSSINFPDGLEMIEEQAFNDCYGLKRVILPDSLQQIANKAFWGCKLSVLRIPEKLTFLVCDQRNWKYIVNPYTKKDKTFGLSSVDTVIFSGNDYDFGYPAIENAKNVYFLEKPPEDVGQILDKDSVEKIYCSDEFEFEWTRSTVASWVRQKLMILPADQLKEITEQEINATPVPTDTPKPTLTPSPTPWPTPMPRPTASPAVTAEPEKQAADPMLFVFAGVLALVVAGIAVVAVKGKKTKKRISKK